MEMMGGLVNVRIYNAGAARKAWADSGIKEATAGQKISGRDGWYLYAQSILMLPHLMTLWLNPHDYDNHFTIS